MATVVVVLFFVCIYTISGGWIHLSDEEMRDLVEEVEEMTLFNSGDELKHLKDKYVCIVDSIDDNYLYVSGNGVYARSTKSKTQTHKDEIYWQLEFLDKHGRAIIKHKNGAHLHRSSYGEKPVLDARLPTDAFYERENAVFNLIQLLNESNEYQIFSNGTPYYVGKLFRSIYNATSNTEKQAVTLYLYVYDVGPFRSAWTISECPSPSE